MGVGVGSATWSAVSKASLVSCESLVDVGIFPGTRYLLLASCELRTRCLGTQLGYVGTP